MLVTSKSLEGLRVEIAEDEALIAEELGERLSRLGAVVVDSVDTGELAIESAKRHRPDVVLMDIRLNGAIDGIEAADTIRHTTASPVVFLTAHSDQDTLRRAKLADPFGYMLKPFHERDLVVAIEMALHRHELEQRLRASEQRYAATLASIGDAVIATDTDGRITFMNPIAEGLTQWRFDEAKGHDIDQVCPVAIEGTQRLREHPVRVALRLGKAVKLDAPSVIVARNNERIPIDDIAAPIKSDSNELLGGVLAFRDIRRQRLADSALQKAEEQLLQVRKMEAIGSLAAGVAHDFNNLLLIINGYTELLLAESTLAPTTRDVLLQIKHAGQRAAELTRQLLAFGRKQMLQIVDIQLDRLVENLARMLRRLIGENITLSISDVSESLWTIRGDPGQIEQAIMNLAINARDAMLEGGRLTIDVQNVVLPREIAQAEEEEIPPGRYVLLTVSDIGIGMDVATQRRIFEPYFTTKQHSKGTGLGLATVYGIVKQSGGYIALESEIAKGTTFKLFFPAVSRMSAPQIEPAQVVVPKRGTESILLVEDDAAVRELMSSALRAQGYTVHEFSSSDAALAFLNDGANAISLLITDLIMPGMSGRELAEKVLAKLPTTRLLYVSGYTDDTKARHGIEEAKVPFLQKPFALNALTEKVRTILDRTS